MEIISLKYLRKIKFAMIINVTTKSNKNKALALYGKGKNKVQQIKTKTEPKIPVIRFEETIVLPVVIKLKYNNLDKINAKNISISIL